jgi:hypothetical protein
LRACDLAYCDDENVRRLILEVQRAREEWKQQSPLLRGVMRAARRGGFERLSSGGGPLNEAAERASRELHRVTPRKPAPTPPRSAFGLYDADEEDATAQVIARATRSRR